MPHWRKVDAFAHFGVPLQNIVWSWSGMSQDGQVVAVQLWKDVFDYASTPVLYDIFGLNVDIWTHRRGNLLRTQHLIWSRDNLDGILKVVLVEAFDVTAEPRRVRMRYPVPFEMKLIDLDEGTGEFRAHVV